MPVLWFGLGLALLIAGADMLVRGASKLGMHLGFTPLVIGLTVVAWGTSAPELAVNLQATMEGVPRVALGNVVGSNIFNVLVVLGLSALTAPLIVARQIVYRDVPLMIGISLVLFVLSLDGMLSRTDGLLLVTGLVAYTGRSIWSARGTPAIESDEPRSAKRQGSSPGAVWPSLFGITAALAVLALGSRWLVDGSVAMAEALGISNLIVGLTIVAAGTSLPEAATSVVATLRGERDIAVGNVVGSNIFNILGVLGVTGVVAPGGVPVPASALRIDIPVMIAVAVACLPISMTGHRISRWEGVLFLVYYVAFIVYVVLNAVQHRATPDYVTIMKFFAIPLAALTLAIISHRAYKERRQATRP